MTPSSRVTALIATFNRANVLAEALDSVLAQSLPASQIIVIDDGSTDSTAALLESYGEKIQVVRQQNGGKPNALNGAMPLVTGDYIWIFDDDDIALPHFLAQHVAALEAHPDADFTYGTGYVVDVDEDGIHRGKRLKPLPAFEHTTEMDETFVRLLDFNFMPQQAVLAKRHCYLEVGPYDEGLVASHDYDMMLRLTKRFPCLRITTPSFIYVQHCWPRGLARDRYGRSERETRWLKDDRQIVRKIYPDLTLDDCLPGRGPRGELSALEIRQALLQRASFAIRRGLWCLARDDLRAACTVASATPLSASECRICLSAIGSYLGRAVAADCLLSDEEMAQWVADLARFGRVAGEPNVAEQVLGHWTDALRAAALNSDDPDRIKRATMLSADFASDQPSNPKATEAPRRNRQTIGAGDCT